MNMALNLATLMETFGPSPNCVAAAADILLVEDNWADAELFMMTVLHYNRRLKIHRASEGAEALEYLVLSVTPEIGKRKVLPKLIILDLDLPGVDGFEFLRHIKRHPVLRFIPIVAFSFTPDQLVIQRCYQLGINAYFVKPTDFRVYQDYVKNFCTTWLERNLLPNSVGVRGVS